MKIKSLLLGFATLCAATLSATSNDTLMTIGGHAVLVDEFEYIYNKNNNANTIDKKNIDESLEMFIDYKLKVLDAQAQGFDTTKAFQDEFQGYRTQLAKPYMTDKDMLEGIYREAYEHMKEDVEVSHILVRLPQRATPRDTMNAYNKARRVRARLMNEDFKTIALEMSEDPSVKTNEGYLGYLTALSVVWSFERAMYALPVGEISAPVRTNYGYHIIKVHNRRPSKGRIRASHIMKRCDDSMTEAQQNLAASQINMIYNELMKGASFEQLASNRSDDRATAQRQGDLSWFSVGRMVKPFEDAAFALNVGEISKPVKTQFGWHIIKVTDRQSLPPYERKAEEIRRALQRENPTEEADKSFMAKLSKEYNLYKNTRAIRPIQNLIQHCDGNDSLVMTKAADHKDVIVAFKGNLVTADKFLKYCVDNKITTNFNQALNEYSEELLLKYEDSQLENKYPEFRWLMSEYYGGLLLFEVSSKEVWDKTSKDKKGLNKYFKKHKKNYAWDSPRAKGIVVKATDEVVANTVLKLRDKISRDSLNRYVKTFTGNDEAAFLIEKGIWKEGDNASVDALVFKKDASLLEKDELYKSIKAECKLQKKYPSSYVDVRGKVSSDYQNYLEDVWVKKLRKKYPVVINKEVLKTVK